jgi:hypothetical protein
MLRMNNVKVATWCFACQSEMGLALVLSAPSASMRDNMQPHLMHRDTATYISMHEAFERTYSGRSEVYEMQTNGRPSISHLFDHVHFSSSNNTCYLDTKTPMQLFYFPFCRQVYRSELSSISSRTNPVLIVLDRHHLLFRCSADTDTI